MKATQHKSKARRKAAAKRTPTVPAASRRRAVPRRRPAGNWESPLQAILDTASEGVLTFNDQGVIATINRAAQTLFNYPPKQAAALTIHQLLPALDAGHKTPAAGKFFDKLAAKSPTMKNRETTGCRTDGSTFPLELTLGKIRLSQKTLYTCFIRDLTERKQAEKNLYENEQRFRTLITTSPDALFINRNGRVSFINSAGLKLFGATSIDQMLGKKVLELFHPDFHDFIRERLMSLYDGREMPLAEEKIVRLDGSERDVEVAASPFEDSNGRAIQVTLRDITSRNEARQALLHYAAMVESSEDAIIGETLDGYITSWNRGAETIFGYNRSEALHKHITIIIPPERTPEESIILEKVRGGQAVEHYETVRQRKDNRLIDISVTVSPIRDARGNVIGAAKIARDITARRQLEREILEIGDREQRRIGYEIHDGLCQQLAGIELKSQVLEQKLSVNSKPDAARAEEISQNVRDAIAYARALAHSLAPVTLETDGLISALHELALTVEKLFKVRCVFDCDVDLPAQNQAVATHLFRLAQEAIANAAKHGRASQISIHFKKDPDRIYLGISDNGVGVQNDPFKPHGMGVRIMQSRAAMIGGTLTIERNVAGGTTVICSAPLPSPNNPTPKHGDAKQ